MKIKEVYKLVFIWFSICMSLTTFAQDSLLLGVKNRKHSINLELLGRSLVFGSVDYEYALAPKFAVGVGLGFAAFQKGDITRNVTGRDETGKYFDTSTTQAVFANYFIGKRNHKVIITSGLTNFMSTYRNTYPKEKVSSLESNIHWNAGLGYQFTGRRMFYRITGYIINLPESDWFPKVVPWGGLSFGWKL
jgi:hypothetical protein